MTIKRQVGISFRTTLALSATLALAVCCEAEDIPKTAPVNFAREVLPILSNKCFICHGPDGEAKDVLRLDSYAAAIQEVDGRHAIDTETPDKSGVIIRIYSQDDPMPPADSAKQLSDGERDILTRWIQQGGKYDTHWAFVPPRKQTLVDNSQIDSEHAIDTYIEAPLAAKGLTLAPQADRETLARRAALVLTGLPPDLKQLSDFLADEGPDAYERFVDQLLDNPRYGEHQARYWLDAVRYGDTHGLHLDNRRGIYPYRDWVIQALNNNLPLNEFITWQLAGDLLPNPNLQQLVATGFVRMNPSTAEGGAIPEEFQAKNNFDRVEAFGTVFLGMSLTCARCHTHKYDPIPQTEYYRLFAFFNNTAEHSMDGNKYEYAPVIKAPATVDAWKTWNELEATRDQLLAQAASHLSAIDDDTATISKRWDAADKKQRLAMLADSTGILKDLELNEQAGALAKQITEAEAAFTTTLIAKELAEPRKTYLLSRGEYNLPTGEPLEPGILKVMSPFPKDAPRTRLGLAQWLTDREHPLVTRVLVNRIWQRTFSYGLVRTPEDFGLQGEQPTHPELLDWLAVELHDSGWDLKHILRLMVTSRTFRQSSAWRADVDDPQNRLFARGPSHRLDAEVIRDVALSASGLLDRQMGGEGVKPYQPAGLWSALMHPASNTKQYVKDEGDKLYRRSLYVYWKRTSPHPMMTLFDAPSRESSCVRRSRTNTSLQSLGLFNETQRVETSRVLAERLLHEAKDDASRLDLLFHLLASRSPTDAERDACSNLLHSMQQRFAANEQAALDLLAIGDAARDTKLNPADHAAWSQVAITVLASDIAISLY